MMNNKELNEAVWKTLPSETIAWAIEGLVARIRNNQYVAFNGARITCPGNDYFILRPKPGDPSQAEIVDCKEVGDDNLQIVFCDSIFRAACAFLILVQQNTGERIIDVKMTLPEKAGLLVPQFVGDVVTRVKARYSSTARQPDMEEVIKQTIMEIHGKDFIDYAKEQEQKGRV